MEWLVLHLLGSLLSSTEANTATNPGFDYIVQVYSTAYSVCEGKQVEQKPCRNANASCSCVDCEYDSWSAWQAPDCSGLSTRKRNIRTANNKCGIPCTENLKEAKQGSPLPTHCNDTNQDCALHEWEDWSRCTSRNGMRALLDQRTRKRAYKNHVHNNGKACNATLEETVACGVIVNRDCLLHPWRDWTSCPVNCGVGVQTRNRRFTRARGNGTLCNGTLKMLQFCANTSCPAPSCSFTTWTDWSGCQRNDGLGRDAHPTQMFRLRSINAPAGQSCGNLVGTTRETKGCNASTSPEDCQLSTWSPWNTCSKICGGGHQTRTRTMSKPPQHNGRCQGDNGLYPALEEVQGCNLDSCNAGDCWYTDWQTWSDCSMLCGPGTKRRSRLIDEAKMQDSDYKNGGCKGSLKEITECKVRDCDTSDCQWDFWQQWSGCTASCGGGTKRRNRQIVRNPSHGGQLCAANSKAEVAACNTQGCHPTKINATWGAWGAWQPCSKSCGGAFQKRTRDVATPNSPNGKPVGGYFSEFKNCSANPPCTPVVDCVLNAWSEWSACSSSCYGIRHRTRTVKTFANELGKACGGADLGNLRIVEACRPGPSEPAPMSCDATPARDCVLAEWEDWSTCTVTCGGGQEYRTRHILSPPSHRGRPCSEALGQTRACGGAKGQPCARVCHDCEINAWSDWGACTACNGQRYRSRSIKKHPNYCGKPCQLNNTREIEPCLGTSHCLPDLFCSWTEWTSFEQCPTQQCGPSTKKRQRSLHLSTTQPVAYLFKGKAPLTCSGTVFKTESCPFVACPDDCTKQDCAFHQWSMWSDDHKDTSNAIGLCKRHRQILRLGSCGGIICTGNLVESKECSRPGTEVVNCELRDWGTWSHCHYVGHQTQRVRTIRRLPQNGGTACNGTMVETKPCQTQTNGLHQPQNCSWNEWFPWSHCSQSCGTGWTMRHRMNIPARNGGQPCTGVLKELTTCDITDSAACNLAPAGTPCSFGDWEPWGMCLGTGQRTRRRDVAHYARMGSTPCNGTLEELGSCGDQVIACKLRDWTDWGTCINSDGHTAGACDRGQTERSREILTPPQNGGTPCDKELEQTKGCGGGASCNTDCVLSTWGAWTESTGGVTVNCGLVQKTRSRTITHARTSLHGAGCGAPVAPMVEYISQDKGACPSCEWQAWSPWSSCEHQGHIIDGVCSQKKRTRSKKPGVSCDGSTPVEEYAQCNTSIPCGCKNGEWASWTAWSTCHIGGSATCGNGYKERTRLESVKANHCGYPATGDTHQVEPCNISCGATGTVNCELNDWTVWSSCSQACGGHTTRSRTIKTKPQPGGTLCTGAMQVVLPCNPGWSTETPGTGHLNSNWPAGCPVGKSKKHCEMTDWSQWAHPNTVTCGQVQCARYRNITQYQEHQGDPCMGALRELKNCDLGTCPGQEACKLGNWTDWSGCNACQGQEFRTRTITEGHATAAACPAAAIRQTQKCGSPGNCVHNNHYCAWADWRPWTHCDASGCDSGKTTRYRLMQNKVGSRRISMGLQPSLSATPNQQKVKYTRSPQQCVTKHDLGLLLTNKSVEECAALCEANPRCIAFESGFDYGGPGTSKSGDCQLKDNCDTTGCDGAHENLDVYIKVGYRKIAASCVNQHNIDNLRYSDKTLEECQRLCDATRGCVAIEYGVAYGGTGAFRPGDCMLNDASDATDCDGHDQNLDLYIKAPCHSGSQSTASEACVKSKCLENGGPDADCCAPPSSASCASGYDYVQGEVCAGPWHVGGSNFFSTCCKANSNASSMVKASVLYELDDASHVEETTIRNDRHPEAERHERMAIAFGAGVVVFGVAAFVWRSATLRRDSGHSYEALSRTPTDALE